MKKVVNILSLLSLISIILMIILDVYANKSDSYTRFIVDWALTPLAFLAFPLFGWTLSFACNKDKIPPKIWLGIYLIVFVIFIASLSNGFVDSTRDLSTAIRKDSSRVSGSMQIIANTKSKQTVEIGGIQFDLLNTIFNLTSADEKCTILYLPNSKYVIDVLDEDGRSLLKKR